VKRVDKKEEEEEALTRRKTMMWLHSAVLLATCLQSTRSDVNSEGWGFYQSYTDFSFHLINSDVI